MTTHAGRRGAAATLCGLLLVGMSVLPVAADSHLTMAATIDGRDLTEVDANDPLRLDPDSEVEISVEVSNTGDRAVFIRSVRLDGRAMGLSFFTFTTRVDLALEPGETGNRTFALDLGDLGQQATGLIPARLVLLDSERRELASTAFASDVQGSLTSVYGVFGISVAAITALLLAAALVRLGARRLPANRWARATRFGVPGVGLGLTLTFTLSALRLMTPNPARWVSLVFVAGAVGLVFGYLSPGPDTSVDDDEDDDLGAVGQATAPIAASTPSSVDLRSETPRDAPATAEGDRTTVPRSEAPPPPSP